MRFKLEHRLGIKAPAEIVWQILADLPAWKDWNPLYPEARGVVGFGELLTLTLALPEQAPRLIRPRILDWAPNEAIHWKLSMMGGLVETTRYLEIEKMSDTGCIFSNGEIFDGLMGPSVAKRMKRPIRAGFAAMGEALRDRAEARWQASVGATT
jgi:hypothetical protein